MKKTTSRKTACFLATVALLGGALSLGSVSASADTPSETRYVDRSASSSGVSTCASAGDIEYVDFATVTEEYITLPYNVPYYYSGLDNACGAVGGGIVVGYYDKYFENLIPDYTAYYTATGKYKRPDSTYVPAMLQSLYDLMQINVVAAGVSEQECLGGLEAYVEGKSLSISYTSVKGSSFYTTTYKNAINNGQPVLLFCNSVTLYEFFLGDTQHEFGVLQVSQDHIIVGMGYRKFTYYDENGNNFRTDTYLRVASGWATNCSGYIRINDSSWLNSGYAVDIY